MQQLLELVQLEGLADRYPSQLSGGQRQRMGLARALAVDPAVLLLDEPFGALDAQVRAELRVWLRRLHEETHTTTVIVTHDQEEAMDVADEVVVMNHGTGRAGRPPRELYEQPANEFVMTFVGQAQPARRHLRPAARPRGDARAERHDARGDGRADRPPGLRGPRRARRRDDGEQLLGPAHARPGRAARARRRARSSTSSRRARRRSLEATPAAIPTAVRAQATIRLTPAGQFAGGEVGQRDLLQDGADVEAQGDPDVAQRGRVRGVSTACGRTPRIVASGPLTARTTSATLIDAAGRASGKPPSRPRWPHELRLAQLDQDVLEERLRDALRLRDCSLLTSSSAATASSSVARSA